MIPIVIIQPAFRWVQVAVEIDRSPIVSILYQSCIIQCVSFGVDTASDESLDIVDLAFVVKQISELKNRQNQSAQIRQIIITDNDVSL